MIIPDGCHIIMRMIIFFCQHLYKLDYFGQDVGEYKPGFHILPPWYKVAFLVSKQATGNFFAKCNILYSL